MSYQAPASYIAFQATYPDVYAAYEQLGATVHAQGPLDEGTRSLVKLALPSALAQKARSTRTRANVWPPATALRPFARWRCWRSPRWVFLRDGGAVVDQRHPGAQRRTMSDLVTRTLLTCPECGYAELLDIPTDT
jgi:hypothetical protein